MKIAVLGLGKMGHAIAAAFQAAGHDVTGWNRSPRRQDGISYRICPDLIASCRHVELVFIITSDYGSAGVLVDRLAAEGILAGKTIFTAPSGTPSDACEIAARIQELGAMPLDCAIMGYPGDIASNRIYLLYAGNPVHFGSVRLALFALGPNQVHVGNHLGAAKALDAGLLARSYSWIVGYFEALQVATSLGVDPKQFAELSTAIIGPFQANVIRSTAAIMSGHHGRAEQASVNVHRAALKGVLDLAKGSGVSTPMLNICLESIEAAADRGLGECDIAAAYRG